MEEAAAPRVNQDTNVTETRKQVGKPKCPQCRKRHPPPCDPAVRARNQVRREAARRDAVADQVPKRKAEEDSTESGSRSAGKRHRRNRTQEESHQDQRISQTAEPASSNIQAMISISPASMDFLIFGGVADPVAFNEFLAQHADNQRVIQFALRVAEAWRLRQPQISQPPPGPLPPTRSRRRRGNRIRNGGQAESSRDAQREQG